MIFFLGKYEFRSEDKKNYSILSRDMTFNIHYNENLKVLTKRALSNKNYDDPEHFSKDSYCIKENLKRFYIKIPSYPYIKQ